MHPKPFMIVAMQSADFSGPNDSHDFREEVETDQSVQRKIMVPHAAMSAADIAVKSEHQARLHAPRPHEASKRGRG